MVDKHYKNQGCDTFKRMAENATFEEAVGFFKYNIDKYTHREKGSNLDDLRKIKVYCDEWIWWLSNRDNTKEEK